MESKSSRPLDWDGLPEVDAGPTIPEQIRLWQKREVGKILCNTAATPQETRRLLKAVDKEVLRTALEKPSGLMVICFPMMSPLLPPNTMEMSTKSRAPKNTKT